MGHEAKAQKDRAVGLRVTAPVRRRLKVVAADRGLTLYEFTNHVLNRFLDELDGKPTLKGAGRTAATGGPRG